jgi:hypothetical protein
MISPLINYLENPKRYNLPDFDTGREVNRDFPGFYSGTSKYYKLLSPFWYQFYALFATVLRSFGVSPVAIFTRLMLYRNMMEVYLKNAPAFDAYALHLGSEGLASLPWSLKSRHVWDNPPASLPFDVMLEELEELTALGLGMFSAVLPRANMFPKAAKMNRVSWLGELKECVEGLTGDELDKVMRYCKYFGGIGRHDAVLDGQIMDKLALMDVDEPMKMSLDAAIKNMKDWTDEDLWTEMTMLLAECKAGKDSKSVMRILEMKAKTMGLMRDDVLDGNAALALIQAQALNKLLSLGFASKRVIDG